MNVSSILAEISSATCCVKSASSYGNLKGLSRFSLDIERASGYSNYFEGLVWSYHTSVSWLFVAISHYCAYTFPLHHVSSPVPAHLGDLTKHLA